MKVSVVIRTYNEERYLEELLRGIQSQNSPFFEIETVLVDSGSTDRTLEIARTFNARIVTIQKSEFSFGRSLNIGCRAAEGDFLVFVSGHCVPCDQNWIQLLIEPMVKDDRIAYVYGRQFGGSETRFSEHQIFAKYFPAASQIPQKGFFCNNANAALRKKIWEAEPFDEEVTGLEDMLLAKKLVSKGHRIAYVAEAGVYHHHFEAWPTIRRRYEREAIALQYIMPEVHLSFLDCTRFFFSAVLFDCAAALEQKRLWSVLKEILIFRLMQFWGAYKGNHEHRKSAKQLKEIYFYPRSS